VKRSILAVVMALVLVVSAVAVAAPKSTRGDRKDAREFCQDLKAAAGKKNFARLMHTSQRKSTRKCKRVKTKREASSRRESAREAVEACKAERDADLAAFQAKYDSHGRGIGRCVSLSRRAAEKESDELNENKVNAARHCRSQQLDWSEDQHPHAGKEGADTSSFAEYWGTNENNRNAFGKCVSFHAGLLNQQDESEPEPGAGQEPEQEQSQQTGKGRPAR
jgi:hypothetical protein